MLPFKLPVQLFAVRTRQTSVSGLKNRNAVRAITSLDQVLADAYLAGDIDIDGRSVMELELHDARLVAAHRG